MIQTLATLIWDTSEYLNIGLGRFAPHIFGLMIGSKPHKVKKHEKDKSKNT